MLFLTVKSLFLLNSPAYPCGGGRGEGGLGFVWGWWTRLLIVSCSTEAHVRFRCLHVTTTQVHWLCLLPLIRSTAGTGRPTASVLFKAPRVLLEELHLMQLFVPLTAVMLRDLGFSYQEYVINNVKPSSTWILPQYINCSTICSTDGQCCQLMLNQHKCIS